MEKSYSDTKKKISDEDIESCRRENYFKKLDEKRVRALGSRDALSYFKLCDEMGLDPEDKQLYDIGLMEDSKSQIGRLSQLGGLENRAIGPMILPRRKTSKINIKMRKQFYELANEQEIIPGNLNDDNYSQVIELLSNVLQIRSLNTRAGKIPGKMPILACDHKQVKAKYTLEYGLAQRQFEPEKFEKTLAKVIFYSTTNRGFSLEDYPDYICNAAESLGLKEIELASGNFRLSNRKGIVEGTRDEIIDYGKNLLRKYNLPTTPEIY